MPVTETTGDFGGVSRCAIHRILERPDCRKLNAAAYVGSCPLLCSNLPVKFRTLLMNKLEFLFG